MRRLALLCTLALHGCATVAPQWAPVARTSATTCAAPGAPASAPWELVTTPVFTFCVPAGWTSSDGHSWRSGGAVLGWCTTATLAQCPNVTFIARMDITYVTPGRVSAELPRSEFGTGCSIKQSADSIAGASVQLAEWQCEGHHTTTARWPSLALVFVGETDDASTAQLESEVYRTVRFTVAIGH